ncbi:MAG: hypothetical protein OEZ06_24550 [Myxococcales bacterium]|nr:hypothetical protein [Myxococcales bacterium]
MAPSSPFGAGSVDPIPGAQPTPDLATACGNGILDPGESCEPALAIGDSCEHQGYDGGELRCLSLSCMFDTSGCGAPLERCPFDPTEQDGEGCSERGRLCWSSSSSLATALCECVTKTGDDDGGALAEEDAGSGPGSLRWRCERRSAAL